MISFVIPAHNEEKYLKDTIKNIKLIANKNKLEYEIIVVDNNSTDNTAHVAHNEGAKVVFQPQRSISMTRNAGVEESSGDIIVFVDADTLPSEELLTTSLNHLNKYKVITAMTTFDKYYTFSSLGVWIYNFLSYIFKLGNGQFIVIKKKDFFEIGGFDKEVYGFEDIYFFRKARSVLGYKKTKVLFQTVKTSGRKFKKDKNYSDFIFQLLGVILNKPIGKDISKSNFWYKNETLDSKSIAFKNIIIFILAILLSTGKFISPQSFFYSYTPIATTIIFILFVGLNFRLKTFCIITLATFIIEALGHKTGLIFGEYIYNDIYSRIGFLGVPIFITLAWYTLLVSLKTILESPLKTSLAIVGVDVLLESFAVKNNLWQWSGHEGIFTAPLQNYAAWFIISYVLSRFIKPDDYGLFYSTASIMLILAYISPIIGIFCSLMIMLYVINKRINMLSDFVRD